MKSGSTNETTINMNSSNLHTPKNHAPVVPNW